VVAAAAHIAADDLAQVVDTARVRAYRGQGGRIVQGGVTAASFDEPMLGAADLVITDDLARGVDAVGGRAVVRQRIVEGGVAAAGIEEAVGAAADIVLSDDLARGIDAPGKRAVGGQGIIEGGVDVDRHGIGPQ
jgi:hypothetical protein